MAQTRRHDTYGAIEMTLAMLLRLINCRFIIINNGPGLV